MDGFTYTNIFDTKGIEYLIIIAFLILIIPFWIAINKPFKIKEKVWEALGILSENILRIPLGLFYSKNHTWTHLEKSGKALVGLDDLLVHLTGKVELSNLRNPGEQVTKGDFIAVINQDGKHLNIASPISGEIQNVNVLLKKQTDAINQDPYGKGWLYKIKPNNWVAETNTCFMDNEAIAWTKRELARFKDFIATSSSKNSPETANAILQEGGELIDHPLAGLPEEMWRDFQSEFLDEMS